MQQAIASDLASVLTERPTKGIKRAEKTALRSSFVNNNERIFNSFTSMCSNGIYACLFFIFVVFLLFFKTILWCIKNVIKIATIVVIIFWILFQRRIQQVADRIVPERFNFSLV